MAKKKSLCRTSAGSFVRNLGWKLVGDKYVQHKFHLGPDESLALLANLRLEQLWQQVSRRWERDGQNTLVPTDRPTWDDVTMAIAEAIRKGESTAKIPLPVPYSAMIAESPLIGAWLDELQSDITVIRIELRNETAQERSEQFMQTEGKRLVALGRRMLHKNMGGATLHAAMRRYESWLQTKYLDTERRVTQWGRGQVRHMQFLRRHLADCALSELDSAAIEQHLDVIRLRPAGEHGSRVSATWTKNVIKQYRAFLRWLNASSEFEWKRPWDYEVQQIRIPMAPHEHGRAARAALVQTYTSAELRLLWQYASPFERLLMLLALNCGFGKAEVSSLELEDINLHQPHPRSREVGLEAEQLGSWILRVRHKTGVYGEWKLWPVTERAIEWWLKQRAKITIAAGVTTLLVTGKGHRFDAPTRGNHPNFQIPNRWFQLTERIRKDEPSFRRLSFNKLRKTAGNLMRMQGGGELAGIFLAHGIPVRSDALLDFYTNRPFLQTFVATDRIAEELKDVFEGVADPFPDTPVQKGGPNISRGKIVTILALAEEGRSVTSIAEELDLSRETVRRWLGRRA